jgi:tetraacyldisaccharide-1-P 4'-kinase
MPIPLKTYLEETAKEIVHFNFDDHHFFEQHELENIRKNYPEFTKWITTEKDGVRLAFHKNWLLENNISLYCLPMKTRLIGNDAADFAETISGFLDYFYKDDNSALNHSEQEQPL